MRKIVFFVLLAIIISISGCIQEPVCEKPYIMVDYECCLDQNDNKICDSDETGNIKATESEDKICGDGECVGIEDGLCCIDCGCPDNYECVNNECISIPEEIIRKYIILESSENYSEFEQNMIEQKEKYTSGYMENYLSERIKGIQESKRLYSEYIKSYEIICPTVYSKTLCEQTKYSLLDSMNEALSSKNELITLLDIKETKSINDEKEYTVTTRKVTATNISTETVVYYLKKVNNSWKIIDLSYPNSERLSYISISEVRQYYQEYIDNISKTFDDNLDTLFEEQKKIAEKQNDKCINFYYRSQIDRCYVLEVINPAIEQKNVSMCDVITNGYYLGKCYGQIASILQDHTLCSSLKTVEYNAGGLGDILTSNNACYSFFIIERRDYLNNEEITYLCNKLQGERHYKKLSEMCINNELGISDLTPSL